MINTIQNKKVSIQVNAFGAELTSIKTLTDGVEMLWQGDEAHWDGQSPLLFPIVGGLEDNTYELNGKTYAMESHGFARRSVFELIKSTEDSLDYRLTSNDVTRVSYPFEFELIVRYQLDEQRVIVTYEVTNKSQAVMPFSIGAHPGFRCPLFDNESMEDCMLTFERPEVASRRFKDEGVLTGKREEFLKGQDCIQLTHSMFYQDAIILDSIKSSWVELSSKNHDKRVRCEFEGFPYIGFWSAPNDGPYVCIEPWYGVDSTAGDAKDIFKKEGILSLEAGASMCCSYSICVM